MLFISACLEADNPGGLAALSILMLGLRSSEILLRRVRDVDAGPDGVLLWIDFGKTEEAKRYMEVPEPLAGLLVHQAQNREPAEYLLPSPVNRGQPCHRNWLLKVVRNLCQLAGVPRVCVHGLRGTWATLTAERGVSSKILAREMGHTSDAVTKGHYIQPGAIERAKARRMLRVIGGGLETKPPRIVSKKIKRKKNKGDKS